MIRLLKIGREPSTVDFQQPIKPWYWDFKKGFLHTEMKGFATPIAAMKSAIRHLGKKDEVITELEVEE